MKLPSDAKSAIELLQATFSNSATPKQSEAIPVRVGRTLHEQLRELAAPRSTEQEAISRAKANGVTMRALDSNSHVVEGPGGSFLFEGSGITDENFTIDPLGQFNVSKAWRMLHAALPNAIHEFSIDAGLLSQLAAIDVDPNAVASLPHHRRILPLLFIFERRGLFLIDGAHRLLARAIGGATSIRGFVLSSRAAEHIRVRVFQIRADGSRVELDTTKGWALWDKAS